MTVLDASALIALLSGRDAHHDAAEALFADLFGVPLGMSRLTLAEVLVAPTRRGAVEEARRTIADLGVREIGLDEESARRLAELRSRTGLRMPDCCVLHAGAQLAAETVATFDRRLAVVAAAEGFAVVGVA